MSALTLHDVRDNRGRLVGYTMTSDAPPAPTVWQRLAAWLAGGAR